eukprot:UN07714
MQHEHSSANLYAIINAFDELCYQFELDNDQTTDGNSNDTTKSLFITWYTDLCRLVSNVKTLV